MNNILADTGGKNWKKHRRDKASKLMPLLLKQSGYRCHWCREPIIWLRTIPVETIVNATANWVTWIEKGEYHKVRIASVDHVLPLKDGIDARNYVAACTNCNRKRSNPRGQNITCPTCGGRKPRNRSKCECCRKGTLNGCPHKEGPI